MITYQDFLFMIELNASSLERSFLVDLRKDPKDEAARMAYADWLEENGREGSAEMVRKGYVPGVYQPTSIGMGGIVARGSLLTNNPPWMGMLSGGIQ